MSATLEPCPFCGGTGQAIAERCRGITPNAAASERVKEHEQTIIKKWSAYLEGLSAPPVNLTDTFAEDVRSVWWKLCWKVGEPLRPPIAGPGGELGFVFSWNTAERCIEIDIGPGGRFEWFFHDRTTNTHAGSDDERCYNPPEALVRLLVQHCL